MNGQQGRRRLWLLPVLAVLALALGGGAGFGLRELAIRADASQPPPSAASPSTTTRPGGPEPGSPVVQLAADVEADPQGEAIRGLLQQHFDAINSRDYDAWRRTVTVEFAAGTTRGKWHNDYQSTQDGSILIQRIEPTPGGLTVLLSFTSKQDLAQAPPDVQATCIRWRVSYPVVTERNNLRLAPGNPAASQKEAC